MTDDGAPATWPRGASLTEVESVAAVCPSCALPWRVHRSMAGFRIRCGCGAWVPVPAPADVRALPGSAALARADAFALDEIDDSGAPPAAPRPRALAGVRGWDGAPLRPDADGSWSLRHAEAAARARWTNRTVLTLVAIVAAFVVPAVAVQLLYRGSREALYLPIVSVASSLLVLVLVSAGREFVGEGLRAARARHFAEAALVAGVAAAVAYGWVRLLVRTMDVDDSGFAEIRSELGLPLTLAVFSLAPGVFEELAFRGLFQGRVRVLMGRTQTVLAVGAAFALAHGVTIGLPFHMGLGIWLTSLRERSGSLYPCMLAHALYNAAVVTALS